MKLTIYFQFVPKFYIFVAYAAPDFGMVGERFHDFALLQYLKWRTLNNAKVQIREIRSPKIVIYSTLNGGSFKSPKGPL